MSEISHRERVELTLNHYDTDRVPMDFMGQASSLIDSAYFKLKKYLGIKGDIKPFREGSTANYYDVRILDMFDIDFRRVFLPLSSAGRPTYHDSQTYTCPWGITWRRSGIYVNAVRHPLKESNIDALEDYAWPIPNRLWCTNGLARIAHNLHRRTDYAIVARNPLTYGFLDRACLLRGTEEFMMDMLIHPEMAETIIRGILHVHLAVYEMFLKEVGPYVSIVETGDDLGGQDNLLISPKLYRKFIKPAQEKLNKLIKDIAPKARIFMHCDGAIFDIIPDLIEIGVDILNPVQPSVNGMDSRRLKENFGDKLTFHGGVEQSSLSGGEDAVFSEVRRRIDAFWSDGGYIFSTCNTIIDAPPSNIVAMFKAARSYSKP